METESRCERPFARQFGGYRQRVQVIVPIGQVQQTYGQFDLVLPQSVMGEIWIPLAANAGSYWNAAKRPPSSKETAAMVRPQSRTSASVIVYLPIAMVSE